MNTIKPNDYNDDILELIGIDKAREEWEKYYHDNIGVPRVTKIIARCIDQSYLMNWYGRIGINKANYYKDKALNVGTIVHELIDKYLEYRYKLHKEFAVKYEMIEEEYREQVYNGINNFILWVNNLESMGYYIDEIIGVEIPVTCPWYGGTIDAIVKINGYTYIVDFKTSKQISSDYLIQASAYMWMINNGYAANLPHINGIGIIRVDKSRYGKYEDLFLNEMDTFQYNLIVQYMNCFNSYVEAYYRSISTDYIFESYKSTYNTDNGLIGDDNNGEKSA